MATFIIEVVNGANGKPIPNANVNGGFNVPACPFSWNPVEDIECTSGPDYSFNGYTDNNGEFEANIEYNVDGQTVNLSITANGFYDYSATLDLAARPGYNPDEKTIITLTPISQNGSLYWDPFGQGTNIPGLAGAEANLAGASQQAAVRN